MCKICWVTDIDGKVLEIEIIENVYMYIAIRDENAFKVLFEKYIEWEDINQINWRKEVKPWLKKLKNLMKLCPLLDKK